MEEKMHLAGAKTQIQATKFFGAFGIIMIIFGSVLALFNAMHDPVLSAITAIIALVIGGGCAMWAVGNFLQHIELDEES
jgi:hypothetical protein